MKADINILKIIENQTFDLTDGKGVRVLQLWTDNNISDEFRDDTLLIGLEDCIINDNGDLEETNGELTAIYLTKYQAIILRNYLDTFIQLAE